MRTGTLRQHDSLFLEPILENLDRLFQLRITAVVSLIRVVVDPYIGLDTGVFDAQSPSKFLVVRPNLRSGGNATIHEVVVR